MSQETYEELWKRLLIYAPECPMVLAKEFINTAYSKVLDHMEWSGVMKESAMIVPAIYSTGTVAVTQGSANVVGTSTVWTAAMVGRQFFTDGNGPYYTIISLGSATAITLDRPYEKATDSSTTYEISQTYLVMPADFLYFISVMDLSNNWKLHTNFAQNQIDVWDAKRSVAGTPWILAAVPFSPDPATLGRVRYEIWPRPSGATTYPIRYMSRPNLLSANSDKPITPVRGDILKAGALAELARWPGTETARNPYYGEVNYRMQTEQFLQELRKIERVEQSMNQTDIHYEDWEGVPYAPIDARYLQSHDVF